MKPVFRRYTPADRDGCLDVFRSNIPRYFREHELPDFAAFIDAGEHPYFVLVQNDRTVGCGGYGQREGHNLADLCWGMVSQAEHGQRLGEFLLLGRLNAIVDEDTAVGVRLATSQHTDGFFRRYGFEVQLCTIDGIAEGLDDVEMRLELNASARANIASAWERLAVGAQPSAEEREGNP